MTPEELMFTEKVVAHYKSLSELDQERRGDVVLAKFAEKELPALIAEIRQLESMWIEERAIRIFNTESTTNDPFWWQLSESVQGEYRETAQRSYRAERAMRGEQP